MKLIENRQVRLYVSLILALVVLLTTRTRMAGFVSFLYTWIAFAASNLIFAWIIISNLHPKKVRSLASQEDFSTSIIFLFVISTAFFSLFTIVFLLQSIPGGLKHGLNIHIALAAVAVFCSWALIQTVFTLRYAHLYYAAWHTNANPETSPGLDFPNCREPDYFDFAYFSFVIGMTFQVSDVQITSKKIRRLALLHGLLSFIYNTVIVALSINIISGIIAH